jgi:hypothetical protein
VTTKALRAEEDTLAAAIAELDDYLEERIEQLPQTRDQLRGGDRLFVSPAVAGHLDALRELGVSERHLRLERDG